MDSYPGGERRTETTRDRVKRAVQLLLRHHLLKERLAEEYVDVMFAFGVIGLLPHMSIEALKTSSIARLSKIYSIITRTLNNPQYEIFTLPESHNWSAHLMSSHKRLMPETTVDPALPNIASFNSLLLGAWKLHHDRSFVSALILFCSVRSKGIRDACTDTLVSQPIANLSQLYALQEYESQLQDLLRFLFVSDRSDDFVAVFYFKLLIATTMLRIDISLSDQQSRLKPLIYCHDEFNQLTPTLSDGELPSEDRIVEHVAERIGGGDKHSDQLLSTMQLVVDFCHADPKLPRTKPDQAESKEIVGWVERLQKIKDEFDLISRPKRPRAEN
ncbi:hypothetical protein FRC12_010864 [Ceratobasidium sp. 428]|nr:hypothetical protein FRC12_010864 [Ceratobasidium sp. 428]